MKELTKITRHYSDGTIEEIQGESLINYQYNISLCDTILQTRSYLEAKDVNWVIKGSEIPQFIQKLDEIIKL